MVKSRGIWFFWGVLVLLLLWEAAARLSGSALILPGPVPVLKKFLALAGDGGFLRSLGSSFVRVILGIAVSAPAGIIAGIASGLDRRVRAFLGPLFQVISAVPVMSVILIAFLWFGQERTPVFTAFLMVFPVMAANTMAGVRSVDGRLRELCVLYKLSRGEQLRRLYIPAIGPFILGGLRSSLSLCWKVVVAAEVLVQPFRALGTGMQTAKAQLETAELFAWTAAAVIAAALSESILTLALWAGKRRRPRFAVHDIPAPAPAMPETPDIALSLTDVSFGFNGTSRNDAPRRGANKARSDYSPDKPAPSDGLLFTGLNLELEGGPVAILGPSGCGKTTLLRLMAGLLRPSSGDIHYKLQSGTLPASAGGPGTAFVFQEPRLLPWLTVLENVILPIEKKLGKAGAVKRARRFLRLLSLEGKENARPDELSGGQRQRVSIARAFAYPAPALFMDEPFQSLDIPLRVRLMDITLKLLAEEPRLIVAVTHDPREAVYLGRRIIVLNAGKVVFDEAADFSREERAYGAPAHGLFEAGLLRVLAGRPFSLAM